MVIAITGTIGSGKSTVGKILKEIGKEIIDCDAINAELLSDVNYLNLLHTAFPYAFPDGIFEKKLLSEKIFSDEGERKKLDELAHPEIMRKLKERIAEFGESDVFVEIPLLQEEFLPIFDKVIVVVSDEQAKSERIARRDGISLEYASKRLHSQREVVKFSKPTIVIENNGDLDSLFEKVRNEVI